MIKISLFNYQSECQCWHQKEHKLSPFTDSFPCIVSEEIVYFLCIFISLIHCCFTDSFPCIVSEEIVYFRCIIISLIHCCCTDSFPCIVCEEIVLFSVYQYINDSLARNAGGLNINVLFVRCKIYKIIIKIHSIISKAS